MQKTLLTQKESITLAKINSNNIGPCSLTDILAVERYQRKNCLGKVFYDALLNNLIDYSEVLAYNPKTNYVINDTVLFDGIYYIALKNNPGEAPLNTDWAKAPKFLENAYNDLWCDYLGRYLALCVMHKTAPHLSKPLGGVGVVSINGKNFTSLGSKQQAEKSSEILVDIAVQYDLLDDFLQDNKNNALYGGYIGYSGVGNEPCTCGQYYFDDDFISNGFYEIPKYNKSGFCKSCKSKSYKKTGYASY